MNVLIVDDQPEVVERLKHSNLSTIPKKGRTKPSPLRAGEK